MFNVQNSTITKHKFTVGNGIATPLPTQSIRANDTHGQRLGARPSETRIRIAFSSERSSREPYARCATALSNGSMSPS